MSFAEKYRNIYDNIYGYIRLDRKKYDGILMDPFFLRLHNIKQMGLTNYVFPDALHTRYAHSLGVYHIIDRVISSQQQNYTGAYKLQDADIECIKVSALLHDIGHLPLSHTIENALERFEDIESHDLSPDESLFFDIPSKKVKTAQREKNGGDTKLHEKLGEFVIAHTSLREKIEKLKLSTERIANGFKGVIPDEVDEGEVLENLYLKHVRNFLHSQLDADRIDYLLRDASFSGVRSGTFDFDKLINEIRYDEKADYGVNSSGIRAVEQFILSRFSAYTQIVFNKNVHGLEFMASDFYFRVLMLRKMEIFQIILK